MNYTLKFYKHRLNKKAKLLNCSRPLQDDFLHMINGKGTITIADLGAGPFSTVGTKHDGTKILVTASDLYADEYNKMIQKAGIKPLVVTKKENMEKLSYPDNTFDIVYCENALDHTDDAIKAVHEMCRISAGWVYLKHFPDSGERHSYKEPHKWNLSENGTLWNEKYHLFLSSLGFKTKLEGRMVVSKWQI